MKYLLFALLVIGTFWCGYAVHEEKSPVQMYEEQGQKDWPYYANYKGSYSEDSGVPINRSVAMSLHGNVSLGVKKQPDLDFENGQKFKDNVREFAISVLKYPNAPIYATEIYGGYIMLCLGDYGNLASNLNIGRVKPTH